jgi:hypothetical protein
LDDEIAVRASATRLRRYATLRSKVELYETALSSSAATLKNELDDLSKKVAEKVVG